MIFKIFYLLLFFVSLTSARTAALQTVIDHALAGLEVRASDDPYSRTIERMFIGYDAQGDPQVGLAYREIESFKPITGVVVVHKTAKGFILHEALFPDILKIRKTKDRKQVLAILKQFKAISFDPHAEKSAVDGLTGATRYGLKASGYLNFMARRIALEMEGEPNWPH